MPTRNVSLTSDLDNLVEQKVQSGRYDNASEVIRAALRALEREDREEQAKLERLRGLIQAGEESGIYEGDISADLHGYVRQLAGKA